MHKALKILKLTAWMLVAPLWPQASQASASPECVAAYQLYIQTSIEDGIFGTDRWNLDTPSCDVSITSDGHVRVRANYKTELTNSNGYKPSFSIEMRKAKPDGTFKACSMHFEEDMLFSGRC